MFFLVTLYTQTNSIINIMRFIRTDAYQAKLFGEALFDEKRVLTDAHITIEEVGNKFKAYCEESGTYLQFPRALREYEGQRFIADVVEVIRTDGVTKYYRAMKGSIRNTNSDEVLA